MRTSFRSPARAQGLTLIELMISIFLGLLIIGAAITVFTSNRQTYRTTESVGRIQENSRTAFELMARDIREAAGNACEESIPVVNVLNSPTTNWYSDFSGGIRGYDEGQAMANGDGNRAAGTDAIELKSSVSNGVTVADHQPTSAQFKMNTVNHGMEDGDIVMVCDFGQAAIFQVTNASPGTNDTVVHNTGTGVPGNSTRCLAVSGACNNGGGAGPVTYAFGCKGGELDLPSCADTWPATVAKLRATRWYVGTNPRNGRSLYQSSVQNASGALSAVNNEIVEGVRDMQLSYLEIGGTDYVDASSPPDWNVVAAVRIELTFEGEDRVGVDGAVLQRQLFHTVSLRNRSP